MRIFITLHLRMHHFTGEDTERQANWVPQEKHGGGLSDVHKHDANGKQSTAAVPGETCAVMSLGHTCSRELLKFPLFWKHPRDPSPSSSNDALHSAPPMTVPRVGRGGQSVSYLCVNIGTREFGVLT